MSKMDSKLKRLKWIILIIAIASLVLILGIIINNNFIKDNLILDNKDVNSPPAVIGDIVYGNTRNIDNRIHVLEGDKYIPYIVIKTNNYGENTVLLMREEVYPKEMMFRDCNLFGNGAAYYPGSLIDTFMENELYEMYSTDLKAIINYSPIKVHTRDYVAKIRNKDIPTFETIYRHVFALSKTECGFTVDNNEEREAEGDFIPEVLEYAIDKNIWLRSEAYGGDDTWASQLFGKNVLSERVADISDNYIRPVFIVPDNVPISFLYVGEDNSKKIYVFLVEKEG